MLCNLFGGVGVECGVGWEENIFFPSSHRSLLTNCFAFSSSVRPSSSHTYIVFHVSVMMGGWLI